MYSAKNKERRRSVLVAVLLMLLELWCGLPSKAQAPNPVPFVSQPLVPDATAPGGPQFTLTVNGTGFASTSTVNWNGSPLTTTFVNGSQLTATVRAADITTAGTASVTVVSPAPGGGTSNTVFFPVTVATSSVAFQTSEADTETGPECIATADFNGDGKLDLAVSSYDNGAVSILLGNGDGTFQPPVNYPVGVNPSSVLVGDFNRDGKLDLAVRNQSSETISILLGNGDGTFQPAMYFATGNGASRMVAGDFNDDGNLDLATTNNSDDTVSILLGNGDGTFQQHVDYPVGPSPLPITTGDINGDGQLDLVVGDTNAGIYSILLGNGNGTFQPYVTYPTIANPQSVVLADFNGDGKLDLAVFSEASGGAGLAILLGNGDGTFGTFATYATGCGSDGTDCTAATADFNGDGHLDLAVRNNGDAMASVFLANGDGTFQNPLSFGAGAGPEQLTVGDFNGDGRLDVVVADLYSSVVSVLLQVPAVPAVAFSPASLSFGPQLPGTASAPQTVTLTNSGGATLNITSITVSANFLQKNNCGLSVAPGASCTITVIFMPRGLRMLSGGVTVTDNASGSPQTIPLSGVGTVVSLVPTSLDFGSEPVGTTSAAQTVTLTNEGSHILSIAGIHFAGSDPGDFAQTNTCGTSVPAGASCSINVTFTPTGKGNRAAVLGVLDNGGASPQKVTVSGSGT